LTVVLLTVDKLRDADWPKDVLAEFHTMPEADVSGAAGPGTGEDSSRLGRLAGRKIARVVALDEFDLESAASLREHLPAAGDGADGDEVLSGTRLAMRTGARAAGVAVPEFFRSVQRCGTECVYGERGRPRGCLKPRWSASAIGIRKITRPEELWPALDFAGRVANASSAGTILCRGEDLFMWRGVTWGGEVLFCGSATSTGSLRWQTMARGWDLYDTGAGPGVGGCCWVEGDPSGYADGAGNEGWGNATRSSLRRNRMGKFYFSGDGCTSRRGLYRRDGGVCHRAEPVGGVGADRGRRACGARSTACRRLREDYSGKRESVWLGRSGRIRRRMTRRRSCTGCIRTTTAGLILRSGVGGNGWEQLLDEYGQRFSGRLLRRGWMLR